MAFPYTSVLDNFTGVDGTDLKVYSANWVTLNSNVGYHELEIQGNAATSAGTSGQDASDAWAATFGPETEVFCTVTTLPAEGGSGYVSLWARLQGVGGDNTFDGYGLEFQRLAAATDRFAITRQDNSGTTYLGADVSQELAAGDSFGISVMGSTLQLYYKPVAGVWATLGSSQVDATYGAAGQIGLYAAGAVVRVDAFGGGTPTGTATGDIKNFPKFFMRRPLLQGRLT